MQYSPLGKGFLTGRFTKYEDLLTEGDMRASGAFPRFAKENFDANMKLTHGASAQAVGLVVYADPRRETTPCSAEEDR